MGRHAAPSPSHRGSQGGPHRRAPGSGRGARSDVGRKEAGWQELQQAGPKLSSREPKACSGASRVAVWALPSQGGGPDQMYRLAAGTVKSSAGKPKYRGSCHLLHCPRAREQRRATRPPAPGPQLQHRRSGPALPGKEKVLKQNKNFMGQSRTLQVPGLGENTPFFFPPAERLKILSRG